MSFFEELKRRNVVRVAIAYSVTAWLVAQIAEMAFESFEAPDWVFKTLLFLLVTGLPFAVIFAWAYELTPEGLKREKDVDRSQSITPQTGRRIDFVIIGVLSVALIFAVSTHQWTDNVVGEPEVTQTTGRQSIAVLPFVNMSDDPENEYFSDGISEELLNVLVKVRGLRVASRTSSFSFKDNTEISIPEIAEKLGVKNVLEGSVRKAGNTVRITAQLIDVDTDAHLWSETYTRELDDIFLIQDEISLAIVNELASTLGADGVPTEKVTKHSTENVEAYELYLRGRYLWQRRGENILPAIELFERAIELDPNFGVAWSSLAAAHITVSAYIFDENVDIEEHRRAARESAEKALVIDTSLAEAHAVLGDLERVSGNWGAAEEHYLSAIESEPSNVTAHLWYAEQLLSMGRLNDAQIEATIAHELDPLSPGTNSVNSGIAEALGHDEDWMRFAEAALVFGHPAGLWDGVEYRIRVGDFDGAWQHYADNKHVLPPDILEDHYMRLWLAAYQVNDRASQDEFLDALQAAFGEGAMFLLPDYVRFDRLDEAFEILGDGQDLIANDWMQVWRSDMSPLRSDSRFVEILESTGIIEYWDQYGWSPLCERVENTVRCK